MKKKKPSNQKPVYCKKCPCIVTPQSLLVETAYEANEFMKTMPNAIILMSDLMSAVMVAEYGINVDKKDNSEVGARIFAT